MMLGLVFTEFIEMVEDRFSPEMADAIIVDVPTTTAGAYTAVGNYPHEELVALVSALSLRSHVPVGDLVRAFGKHLCKRFAQAYPHMFERHPTMFDFVEAIDGEIHVEVRKLYSNAMLPRFTVRSRTATELQLHYESPRRMEPLALGLLDGLALHYQAPCLIKVEPAGADSGSVFTIALRPGAAHAT